MGIARPKSGRDEAVNMQFDDYTLQFADGGVQVLKNGRGLYFNSRPVYVCVKTEEAMLRFRRICNGKRLHPPGGGSVHR